MILDGIHSRSARDSQACWHKTKSGSNADGPQNLGGQSKRAMHLLGSWEGLENQNRFMGNNEEAIENTI